MSDEEKEVEEELDLDQQLDMLDLDANFLDSNSFEPEDDNKANNDEPAEPEEPTPLPVSPTKPKSTQSVKPAWSERTEIYSRHFKPDPQEREELEEIASKLGVKSGLPKASGLLLNKVNPLDSIIGNTLNDDENDPHNPQSQWNRLVNGKATKQTHNLPVSIVLQRGTVMYKDVNEETGEPESHHGCELILLTRGFLLVKPEQQSSGFFGKKQDVLTILGSALWTDVRQIQTTAYQSLLLTCGVDVHFDVLPSSDLDAWKTALQTIATQCHYNFSASMSGHVERGWQYRLCSTPWFTEAVTGEFEDLGQELATADSAEEGLDQLDDYHSYAPLHYATRANHVDVMRKLMEAGANPNVEDGEGKTPMYYAERDQLPAGTTAVLTEFGAKPSQKAQEEMRGELFGKVNITNQAREAKREAEAAEAARAAQEKAESANSQMQQNMAAMHKRGEMIEELGDKATELQDGARDYGDMAAQLKAKMKKKSIWGF